MTPHPAIDLALAIGQRLADPETAPAVPRGQAWWRQSLAHGIPGIALLHIELAAAGLAPWQPARDWLTAAARLPVTSGPASHPCYGAPALAHALACAADQLPGSCQRVLGTLDRQITADSRRRLAAAASRIDQRQLPALAEFDALQGLAGYGAYLLRRDPGSAVVRDILEYLVRLTEPITLQGLTLPGWWTPSGPSGRAEDRFPGGHSNNGLAHGIAGGLSFLSLAERRGTTVPGQHDAIRRICSWLDQWRLVTDRGPAWPYWVTRADLQAGQAAWPGPARPSWCYGTAGLARAQQLAALALGDPGRQVMAEDALARALTDPAQLAATTDSSLCHGYAGLAHIACLCAADAVTPASRELRDIIPRLLDAVHAPGTDPEDTAAALLTGPDPGFLDGAAGVALAVLAPATARLPRTAWDACLLIA